MLSKKDEKQLIQDLRKRGIGVSRTEDMLAEELRKKKLPYQRQVRIGMYRVDFYIPPSIVIDVEGPHHEEFSQSLRDIKRRERLESKGYHQYVFSAQEVYENPRRYAELIASEYEKLSMKNTQETAPK